MVTPALQLSSKIPDIDVQLWGTAILKDLHRMVNDMALEEEAHRSYLAFSQNLLTDQYQSTRSPEHNLVNWFSGDPPPAIALNPNYAVPSTSQYPIM